MQVKDLMDKLQPGAFYQRMGQDPSSKKPMVITGQVMSHNVDDNGVTWVTVVELYIDTYNAVTFGNRSNLLSIFGPDMEFAMLTYSQSSIEEALELLMTKIEKKYEEAHLEAMSMSRKRTTLGGMVDDFERKALAAEVRAEEVGQGTLTAREDYDQRVLAAVNEVDLLGEE